MISNKNQNDKSQQRVLQNTNSLVIDVENIALCLFGGCLSQWSHDRKWSIAALSSNDDKGSQQNSNCSLQYLELLAILIARKTHITQYYHN